MAAKKQLDPNRDFTQQEWAAYRQAMADVRPQLGRPHNQYDPSSGEHDAYNDRFDALEHRCYTQPTMKKVEGARRAREQRAEAQAKGTAATIDG